MLTLIPVEENILIITVFILSRIEIPATSNYRRTEKPIV